MLHMPRAAPRREILDSPTLWDLHRPQTPTWNAPDLGNEMHPPHSVIPGTCKGISVHPLSAHINNSTWNLPRAQYWEAKRIPLPQVRDLHSLHPESTQGFPVPLTLITSSSLFLCISCFSSSTILAMASFSVSWSFSDNYPAKEKWIKELETWGFNHQNKRYPSWING